MITKSIVALFVGAFLAGSAQATLIDRGGGLIYDDDLNITWVADANYAKTQYVQSGGVIGDADGLMFWSTSITWADSLSYYDSVRGVTYTDWRLPITLQPDPSCALQIDFGSPYGLQSGGNSCTGSELGHLFYSELSGTAGLDISNSSDSDLGLFTNIQPAPNWEVYWSGTEFAAKTTHAWAFGLFDGSQYGYPKLLSGGYAWAVRDGDVAAAAVPEPEILPMFLAGLGLIGFMASRRKKS